MISITLWHNRSLYTETLITEMSMWFWVYFANCIMQYIWSICLLIIINNFIDYCCLLAKFYLTCFIKFFLVGHAKVQWETEGLAFSLPTLLLRSGSYWLGYESSCDWCICSIWWVWSRFVLFQLSPCIISGFWDYFEGS